MLTLTVPHFSEDLLPNAHRKASTPLDECVLFGMNAMLLRQNF